MKANKLIYKDQIERFDYRDLQGKILEIKVAENSSFLSVIGVDREAGKIYMLLNKEK